jgi:hypothetical protein
VLVRIFVAVTNTRGKQFKGGRIYFLPHDFRGLSPWLASSIALRPTAKQKHHGGRRWQAVSKKEE